MRLVKMMFNPARQNRQGKHTPSRFVLYETGFHGDEQLLAVVDTIMQSVKVFVETGTNVGSTLAYVARKYPHVRCFSCEPDMQAFQYAHQNTSELPNVYLFNETSQHFLERIQREYPYLFKDDTLFWLDAHGYGFEWPLRDEISFITRRFRKVYILIDDFKVPGLDCFKYDAYQGQECSFEYIKDALDPTKRYALYYPNYTERTSEHHPLRGWGLIEFGHEQALRLPDSLRDRVRRAE